MAVYFPEVNNIILLTSRAGNKLERETGLSALPREAKPPKGGQINQFPSRGLFPSLGRLICNFINQTEMCDEYLQEINVRLFPGG